MVLPIRLGSDGSIDWANNANNIQVINIAGGSLWNPVYIDDTPYYLVDDNAALNGTFFFKIPTELQFLWVKNNYPNETFASTGVKIDNTGKLQVFHNYNLLQIYNLYFIFWFFFE